MATATAPKLENPKIRSDLNSTPPPTEDCSVNPPPASPGGSSVDSKDKSAAAVVRSGDADVGGSVTDIQKKMKRAERFGVPVQLSEVEKRNSRAERFGTGSTINALDSSKTSEQLKRKARAERFGIVQPEPCDEETKKKARLARFGSLSKADSVEEDKKKARAIRFSQSGSGSSANEKGNTEVKTAMPGELGGGNDHSYTSSETC